MTDVSSAMEAAGKILPRRGGGGQYSSLATAGKPSSPGAGSLLLRRRRVGIIPGRAGSLLFQRRRLNRKRAAFALVLHFSCLLLDAADLQAQWGSNWALVHGVLIK
jgi:hypothetical protein